MKTPNEYLLDDDHPVPNLGVIDVNTVKMGGGLIYSSLLRSH